LTAESNTKIPALLGSVPKGWQIRITSQWMFFLNNIKLAYELVTYQLNGRAMNSCSCRAKPNLSVEANMMDSFNRPEALADENMVNLNRKKPTYNPCMDNFIIQISSCFQRSMIISSNAAWFYYFCFLLNQNKGKFKQRETDVQSFLEQSGTKSVETRKYSRLLFFFCRFFGGCSDSDSGPRQLRERWKVFKIPPKASQTTFARKRHQ